MDSQNPDCVYTVYCTSRFASMLRIAFEDTALIIAQFNFYCVSVCDAIRMCLLLVYSCTYRLIVIFKHTHLFMQCRNTDWSGFQESTLDPHFCVVSQEHVWSSGTAQVSWSLDHQCCEFEPCYGQRVGVPRQDPGGLTLTHKCYPPVCTHLQISP